MRETLTQIMCDVPIKEGTRAKRLANNTAHYIRPDGTECWRLHHTDIVTKTPKGVFQLDSGGWQTNTTKDRLNAYAPCGVYAHKGVWYVSGDIPFFDGIKIGPEGKILNAGKAKQSVLAQQRLITQINRFCKKLDELAELPAPNAGDCWLCGMFHREKPPGELQFNTLPGQSGPSDNADHILSHVREGYIHGALLMNALVWAGYKNPSLIFDMDNADLKRGRRPDMVKRALRRYLRRKLGVG